MRKKSSTACAPKEYPAVLRQQFCYCFSKAAMKMRGMLDEELGDYGIIAIQFGILRLLVNSGSMSQIELGSAAGIDKATIVKLIDELEAKGLLIRKADENDRRVKTLEVTKKGKALADKATKTVASFTEKFLSPLTAHERDVLRVAIPKLLGIKS